MRMSGGVRNAGRVWAVLALAALFWADLSAPPAVSHSFYDRECCSDRDCEPLDEGSVKVTPGGYRLPNGQVIAFADARWSPDGRYHWCRASPDRPVIRAGGKACLWVPVPAL